MKNFFIFFALISSISTSIFSYEIVLNKTQTHQNGQILLVSNYFLIREKTSNRWQGYLYPFPYFESNDINLDIYEIMEHGTKISYQDAKDFLVKEFNEQNYGLP